MELVSCVKCGPSRMISAASVLTDIRQQWKAIAKLCDPVHRVWFIAEGCINETRPEDSYNLPFVLAFAVLDQVLGELRDQGVFACAPNALLGKKMDASKS